MLAPQRIAAVEMKWWAITEEDLWGNTGTEKPSISQAALKHIKKKITPQGLPVWQCRVSSSPHMSSSAPKDLCCICQLPPKEQKNSLSVSSFYGQGGSSFMGLLIRRYIIYTIKTCNLSENTVQFQGNWWLQCFRPDFTPPAYKRPRCSNSAEGLISDEAHSW